MVRVAEANHFMNSGYRDDQDGRLGQVEHRPHYRNGTRAADLEPMHPVDPNQSSSRAPQSSDAQPQLPSPTPARSVFAASSSDESRNLPPRRGGRSQRDVARAQQTIYEFLLEIVQNWRPDDVLDEFRRLFIEHVNTTSEGIIPALYEIVFANDEAEFLNTLKRSCYILVNNWEITRSYEHIQKLVQLFHDSILERSTMSPTLRRLRGWIKKFTQSPDFHELELFASRYDNSSKNWSQRYVSYLLVPQYVNLNNPVEQREAAKLLSRKLKERFKYDLALYTACSERTPPAHPTFQARTNPTHLGDDVLRMVKMIVVQRGKISYNSLARVFLQQTQDLAYRSFKQSLLDYLIYSVGQPDVVVTLRQILSTKLETLYETYHDRVTDESLRLRTCNRVIEYLTTENRNEPSPLFAVLLSEGTPLTLVVILLKLILISRYSKTHLETRIAELIQYYSDYSEEDCNWLINFLEIFRITMTIHAENVEYNLVSMLPTPEAAASVNPQDLDAYRVFSQLRHAPIVEEMSEAEIVERLMMLSSEQAEESTQGEND
jgi:hypothetical protein